MWRACVAGVILGLGFTVGRMWETYRIHGTEWLEVECVRLLEDLMNERTVHGEREGSA